MRGNWPMDVLAGKTILRTCWEETQLLGFESGNPKRADTEAAQPLDSLNALPFGRSHHRPGKTSAQG